MSHLNSKNSLPFVRARRQTFSWITSAAVRGLTQYTGQPKNALPVNIILDDVPQLPKSDEDKPYNWTDPKQATYGPLSDKQENDVTPTWVRRARKDAFFDAIRNWKPNQQLQALGLDTKYKLQYVLDKENQNRYQHTILILSDDDDAMVASEIATTIKVRQLDDQAIGNDQQVSNGRGRGRGYKNDSSQVSSGRGRGRGRNQENDSSQTIGTNQQLASDRGQGRGFERNRQFDNGRGRGRGRGQDSGQGQATVDTEQRTGGPLRLPRSNEQPSWADKVKNTPSTEIVE